MNLFANVAKKNIGLWGVAALLIVQALVPVASSAAPAVEAKRFLFIVDTSASMKPLEVPVREALFDLIYSGVRGRMTNNDTYGVWLISDENDTAFPMQSWKPKFNVETGAKAVEAIKNHGFKGKARLDLALADARRIIKNVDDLTIILVSNGEAPVAGTPFDNEINAQFRELAPVMKRAKATVNLSLVAQDGEFVAWALNSPEFLIDVPFVEPKVRPVKVELVTAKTNSPAKAASNSVAMVAEKPRIAATPIIITKESVAQERRSYTTAIANLSEPAVAVVTNPASAPVLVAVPVATNLPATPTNHAQVITTPAATLVSSTNAAAAAPVVANTKAEPTNAVAAMVVPERAVVVPATGALKVVAPSYGFLWAVTGASVMLAGVFGVMLFFRGRRRESSLISQSLLRERLLS